MTSKFIPVKVRPVQTFMFDNIKEAYINKVKAEKEGYQADIDPIVKFFSWSPVEWKLTLYREEK